MEWRDVGLFDDPGRITAEAIFAEPTGDATLAYRNLRGTDRSHGSTAVVGLENSTGSDGFEYSYHLGVLTDTTAITFHPPA